MALFDIQVILKHENGMPEDRYVNTLHYEINAPDTIEGTCDDINGGYLAFNTYLASIVNGMEIKVYPPGLNPTGPVFEKSYANIVGGGSTGPAEVACCLSYATVDNPDASLPRRRGRIYLGPLVATGGTNSERPPAALTLAARNLGVALAAAGNAGNSTWMLRSQSDNAYAKIESVWTDDAWDTQRRRGLKPLSRVVVDVQ
jgi:hypothetical protein